MAASSVPNPGSINHRVVSRSLDDFFSLPNIDSYLGAGFEHLFIFIPKY